MHRDSHNIRISACEFPGIYDVCEFGLAVALPRSKDGEVLDGGEFGELDSSDGVSAPAKRCEDDDTGICPRLLGSVLQRWEEELDNEGMREVIYGELDLVAVFTE